MPVVRHRQRERQSRLPRSIVALRTSAHSAVIPLFEMSPENLAGHRWRSHPYVGQSFRAIRLANPKFRPGFSRELQSLLRKGPAYAPGWR
jgi:hypothetical protein